MKENIKKNIKWIVFGLAVIIFATLAVLVTKNPGPLGIDKAFYGFLQNNVIKDFLTPIVKVITKLSGTVVLIVIAVLILVFIKNKKQGVAVAINLALAPLTNQIVKQFFRRPRPALEYRLIEETGFSFPSGHSMTSMAFYGFLIYLVYNNVKNKTVKWMLITLLSLVILSVGFSRIYLGVHYTSDVLGGFVEGIAYLVLFTTVCKKFEVK